MPLLLAPLVLVTWFARQNHFEWMFNPLPNAAYAKVSEVNFVNDSDMVLAVEINGKAVAYPMDALRQQRLVINTIDTTPIFVALGDDNKSVRAFERTIDGRALEFFVKDNQFVDAETGSTWDFSGKAISGALTGKELKKISVLKDYWFDWKIYHPDTSVYTANK